MGMPNLGGRFFFFSVKQAQRSPVTGVVQRRGGGLCESRKSVRQALGIGKKKKNERARTRLGGGGAPISPALLKKT